MTHNFTKPSPVLPLYRLKLSGVCFLYQLQIDSLDLIAANVYARDELGHCDKKIAKISYTLASVIEPVHGESGVQPDNCGRRVVDLWSGRPCIFYLHFAHRKASFMRIEGCGYAAARRASLDKQEPCTSRGGSDPRSRLP